MSNAILLADAVQAAGSGVTDTGLATIGFGTSAIGAGVGAGLIWAAVINGTARQPEAQGKLMGIAWISYVLVELLMLIGLVLYFIS